MSIPDDLEFLERVRRDSPYTELVKTLVDAGNGKVLVLDEPARRTAITAREKKLGIGVEFAISGGKLYVRLSGKQPGKPNGEPTAPAHTTQPPSGRAAAANQR